MIVVHAATLAAAVAILGCVTVLLAGDFALAPPLAGAAGVALAAGGGARAAVWAMAAARVAWAREFATQGLQEGVARALRRTGHAEAAPASDGPRAGFRLAQLDAQTVSVGFVGARSPAEQRRREGELRRTLRVFGYEIAPSPVPGAAFVVRSAPAPARLSADPPEAGGSPAPDPLPLSPATPL